MRRLAVVSSKGTSFFNDMLGTTVGAKSGKQYSAATLSAFGARELEKGVGVGERRENLFFTGKPEVAGLGYAFLMRNYRAGLGKWQTADPMGYPDGWNQLAYCGNGVTSAVDLWGCKKEYIDIPFDWYDFWNNFRGAIANKNDPALISSINENTANEEKGRKGKTVYTELPEASIKVWGDWVKTEKTRDYKGYTEYKYTKTLYRYEYDVILLLEEVKYETLGGGKAAWGG